MSFAADPAHLMTDVYSYPFPEVRRLLGKLKLPPEFMLNSLAANAAQGMLKDYAFSPELRLTKTPDGLLDLNELHVPVIDRIRARIRESLPGLESFTYAYPTPGSSQSMLTLLAEWHARGDFENLAVLNGEYGGYARYAAGLKIPVVRYDSLQDARPNEKELWFISNPSARDGDIIDGKVWSEFVAAGHYIVFDAAYVGLTESCRIDVNSPNIKAVLTSPSKIFGVFRYRNTGITYTRKPIESMHGTGWFKDVPALLDTLKLYETFGQGELFARYRPAQLAICGTLSDVIGVRIEPSDVLLLARSTERLPDDYRDFVRAGNYRFGLAKLFEDYEAQQPKENS